MHTIAIPSIDVDPANRKVLDAIPVDLKPRLKDSEIIDRALLTPMAGPAQYLLCTWPDAVRAGVLNVDPIPDELLMSAYTVARNIMEHNAEVVRQYRRATA